MVETISAQNKKIADNIRQFGWHCLHILPLHESQDRFSYTIGFEQSFGSPEVLIFGLEKDKAHSLLNNCAVLLKEGAKISTGVEDSRILAGGYSVIFRPVRLECFDEYLGTALRYYKGQDFGAVVMFLPDRQHRFPWHLGYDYISAEEPLSIV